MERKLEPITLEAEIEVFKGSDELKQEVASIVKFPDHKTPDMLFFSGIFVSSGENLNKAYFMPSELVKAHKTISNKPLDIEHSEDEIVGHIYDSAFVDQAGNKLDINELSDMNPGELEDMDIDVMIAGILYKSRFPELAEEVKDNKWKLSMETYFQNYDVKIGNMILSKKEAEALGLASEDVLGRVARVLQKGKEIAKGEVARVLRGLLFSGCGLVKNPANPRSVILETAKRKGNDRDELVVELEPENGGKEGAESIVTSPTTVKEGSPDSHDVRTQTSPGICVSYKKYVMDAKKDGPEEVVHENWCTLYEMGCTSPSRSADHPECIRNIIVSSTKNYTQHKLSDLSSRDRRAALLKQLLDLM